MPVPEPWRRVLLADPRRHRSTSSLAASARGPGLPLASHNPVAWSSTVTSAGPKSNRPRPVTSDTPSSTRPIPSPRSRAVSVRIASGRSKTGSKPRDCGERSRGGSVRSPSTDDVRHGLDAVTGLADPRSSADGRTRRRAGYDVDTSGKGNSPVSAALSPLMPVVTTIRMPSRTDRSVMVIRLSGTMTRNPPIGLGAMGTKTL